MRYDFCGAFAEHIQGLIRQKQAVGFRYKGGEQILYRFENFCKFHFPDETDLTEVVVKRWIEDPNGYKNAYQSYRMAAVRNLAIYMRGMGLDAYVLPTELYPKPDPKYTARIYSKEEIARIFQCADKQQPVRVSPCLHLIIPVIYRLLYCCGLRPCEALKLRMEDTDLSAGEIRIIQSKGHKDRLVVMSDDMARLCVKYNELIEAVYPGRTYFFENVQTGRQYGKTWISKHFNRLLEAADIDTSFVSNPRLYDLRHTFATHCIQQWIEQGKDVNAKLLYLCEYLGHKDVTNTAYYIHLIPAEFRERSKVSTHWYSYITAEVPCED
jgi:integrase